MEPIDDSPKGPASEARITLLRSNKSDYDKYKVKYRLDLFTDLYFITYKYLKGNPEEVTTFHYSQVMAYLDCKGLIHDYSFEIDSTGRLHFHCIYKSRRHLYLNGLFRKGFTCKVKNVYDEEGLKKYIHKCQNSQPQRINNNVYMF